MSSALSVESQSFLDDYIESVEDLEIVLLLRTDPKHDWDALEVSRQIGLEPIAASNRLMHLYLGGVLDHPAKAGRLFHFRHQGNSKREKCLAELASVFEKSRMEVVTRILTKQQKQLRQFADAFQLDRAPKDG